MNMSSDVEVYGETNVIETNETFFSVLDNFDDMLIMVLILSSTAQPFYL